VNRRRRLLLAIVVAVVVAVGLSSGSVARAAPPSDTAPPSAPRSAVGPPATTFANEFLPAEANLGDCISALPRPDCGSEARGGWRQAAVFGVLAVALVAIGVRLAVAVRRRDRATSGA
jgi:hypothetical protein